jgi:hypothetical protein
MQVYGLLSGYQLAGESDCICVTSAVSDIELEFKKQLQKLVPMMLAPENLVVKEIGGQKVKAKELLQYFKSYLEIYRGDELPEPKSMLVVSMFFYSTLVLDLCAVLIVIIMCSALNDTYIGHETLICHNPYSLSK